jgi:peroxiredoxin
MAKLKVGDHFPTAKLQDIAGVSVELPAVFSQAPATVVFFYRGRW